MKGHPCLAAGDLACGAGVLPRHACRGVTVLEEAGVIDDQCGWPDGLFHLPREPGPHVCRVPGAGGDEVREGLPVAVPAEPGRHRLDRLALSLQQQPPQIHPAPPALIRPRERLEHILREVLQITPDRSQLLRRHNRSSGHATGNHT